MTYNHCEPQISSFLGFIFIKNEVFFRSFLATWPIWLELQLIDQFAIRSIGFDEIQ